VVAMVVVVVVVKIMTSDSGDVIRTLLIC